MADNKVVAVRTWSESRDRFLVQPNVTLERGVQLLRSLGGRGTTRMALENLAASSAQKPILVVGATAKQIWLLED